MEYYNSFKTTPFSQFNMKRFIFIIPFLFVFNNVSYGQAPVTDRYPTSTIYIFNYQTNQESLATSTDAVLFKDALIDLVTGTATVRSMIKLTPGKKSFIITQSDPRSGNVYQLTYQSVFLRQVTPIYTYVYNADQNTLSYYNRSINDYTPEVIQGNDVVNLNNCQQLSRFNDPNAGQPVQQAQEAQQAAEPPADNTPVDAEVTTNAVPPALPDYEQPECPAEGYLWQPGYWAFSAAINQYYWVPGAWVAPPNIGLLWTPPYWGYDGGVYAFHSGYWGNTIGFYGGINYGYGYAGAGFVGGDWHEGHFRYNTAIMRVNGRMHYVYEDRTVIYRGERSHYAFNGRGGIMARPSIHEREAMREHHIMATPEQRRNMEIARDDKRAGRETHYAVDRVPEKRENTEHRNGIPERGPAGEVRNNGAPGTRPGAPVAGTRAGTPATAGTGVRPVVPGVPTTPGGRPGVPGTARPGTPAGGTKATKAILPPKTERAPKTKDKKN
jgi:hypothetical protein